MPELEKTELRQAFEWTCDACGKDNFVRAITVCAVNEEERVEITERCGEGWEGQLLMAPTTVTCQHCGCVYETLDQRSDDYTDF